ncbi:hypothetical protein HYPBUDRAFT_154235 [Hyphopichia burtonii NRRL Y-1933]|uniref:Uncharacterized protein n=1 Tax=Hyphopichia burtonii NRRL Y-1933 TaxID=984485 RepID=A0A1E4RCG6_9ASCO|nr:hypothetical protein HYPBUDRAFT_154235 [Hyphopichia burtonii NRRL Y-1933]ODV64968.1 hypothetical protein HYPBUDRAFT_154235 [Hyphopichia burtonii NRRL Y-1933]
MAYLGLGSSEKDFLNDIFSLDYSEEAERGSWDIKNLNFTTGLVTNGSNTVSVDSD